MIVLFYYICNLKYILIDEFNYFARITIGQTTIRDVFNNDATSTYHAPTTNVDALYHRSPGTNPRTLAHGDIATQHRAWRQMHKISNTTFMVDAGSRVDNTVATYLGFSLYDSPLHYHRTLTDGCKRGNHGRRMDG